MVLQSGGCGAAGCKGASNSRKTSEAFGSDIDTTYARNESLRKYSGNWTEPTKNKWEMVKGKHAEYPTPVESGGGGTPKLI